MGQISIALNVCREIPISQFAPEVKTFNCFDTGLNCYLAANLAWYKGIPIDLCKKLTYKVLRTDETCRNHDR